MGHSRVAIKTDEARSSFVAKGKRLEYFTLGWNSLEALIALFAGAKAGSVALQEWIRRTLEKLFVRFQG